jgi:hypothetical protein
MVNDEELLQGLLRCRQLGALPQVREMSRTQQQHCLAALPQVGTTKGTSHTTQEEKHLCSSSSSSAWLQWSKLMTAQLLCNTACSYHTVPDCAMHTFLLCAPAAGACRERRSSCARAAAGL